MKKMKRKEKEKKRWTITYIEPEHDRTRENESGDGIAVIILSFFFQLVSVFLPKRTYTSPNWKPTGGHEEIIRSLHINCALYNAVTRRRHRSRPIIGRDFMSFITFHFFSFSPPPPHQSNSKRGVPRAFEIAHRPRDYMFINRRGDGTIFIIPPRFRYILYLPKTSYMVYTAGRGTSRPPRLNVVIFTRTGKPVMSRRTRSRIVSARRFVGVCR